MWDLSFSNGAMIFYGFLSVGTLCALAMRPRPKQLPDEGRLTETERVNPAASISSQMLEQQARTHRDWTGQHKLVCNEQARTHQNWTEQHIKRKLINSRPVEMDFDCQAEQHTQTGLFEVDSNTMESHATTIKTVGGSQQSAWGFMPVVPVGLREL